MARLFNLEPLSVRTWRRESLWSYICRLSECHRLAVRDLITRVIWVDASWRGPRNRAVSDAAKYVDLGGEATKLWVHALESLTGRRDLTQLTFLPAAHAIRFEGSLHKTGSVCIECLREMASSNVYQPLCWSLSAYTICTTHYVCMTRQCAVCGTENIARAILNKRVGCCGNCGSWLGGPRFHSSVLDDGSRYQLAASEMAQSLVGVLSDTALNSLGSGAIMEYAARHYFDSHADLGRATSLQKSTLSTLSSRKTRPSIDTVVAVSIAAGVSLGAMVRGAARNKRARRRGRLPLLVTKTASNKRRPALDVSQTERKLKRYLEKKRNAPTLEQIARELDISARSLRASFPALCKQLVQRHREWVRSKAAERAVMLNKQLLAALATSVLAGEFPTVRTIGLLNRGLLATPSVRQCYSRIIKALELDGFGTLPSVLRRRQLAKAKPRLLQLLKDPSGVI